MAQQVSQLVLDQLASDPAYAIDFVIDNNTQQVQANLDGLNLLGVSPQDATRKDLRSAVFAIDDEETLRQVLAVPYVNENGNYTGGYEEYLSAPPTLRSGQENTTGTNRNGAGLSIVNGILNIGTGYFGYASQQEITEQQQIQLQMQQNQLDYNIQVEEGRKVFGLNPNIFLALLGAVVVMVIVVAVKNK